MEKLTFSNIIRNSAALRNYLLSIHNRLNIPSTSTHQRLLNEKNLDAIFCDKFLKEYGISVDTLERLILDNCDGYRLYCIVCGNKLKNRNIRDKNQTCSHKCGSINAAAKQSIAKTKNRLSLAELKEKHFAAYKAKHHISDDLDVNMTDIKESVGTIKAYIKLLEDCKGNPNISTHNKLLKENNPDAILVCCTLMEYEITLKELKRIVETDFKEANFFCKTCGKRVADISRQFCSVKCEMSSPEQIAKRKASSLSKYGVEHHIAADEVRRKSRETCLRKYGVPVYSMSDESKAKVQNTCLEKYGAISSWKNPDVIAKISAAKSKKARIKNYKILTEHIQNNDLELLTTEQEYSAGSDIKYRCLKCGKTFTVENNRYIGYYLLHIFCNSCDKHASAKEKEVFDFLRSLLPEKEIIFHDRKAVPGFELDAYIPTKNLAIEFDGVYWHSTNKRLMPPNYHQLKTIKCVEKGIRLIHIFENEWNDKREIVQSIVKNKLGLCDQTYYARKCKVARLSDVEYHTFLNANHIQGYAPSAFKLGLIHDATLVACLGIDQSRFVPNEIELIRFCTLINTRVIGALSKLLAYSDFSRITSYLDLRYFDGTGYEKCGFNYISMTEPGYMYIKEDNILSRYQCQKHRLPAILGDKFDPKLTEVENMTKAGYCQVYNCGMLKYELVRE